MNNIECNEIMRRLPHRYPFLMIDRVLEIDYGFWGRGLKNITINEPYFQGHFPGKPIVPGVMMIEMIAQMAALVYEVVDDNEIQYIANQVGVIVKIEDVKFIENAVPGDQLIIEVENKIIYENFIKVNAKILKNSKKILTGRIIVTANK